MSPKEIFIDMCIIICRLPRWRSVKNLAANAGDIREAGWISVSGRSPGGGHGNPLQYSCLENPMDRGTCWATVHGVAKSWTRLSDMTELVVNLVLIFQWCFVGRGQIRRELEVNRKLRK